MREILFRGQIKHTKGFIYWNVLGQIKTVDGLDTCFEYQKYWYSDISVICGLLDFKTVGQYTGLTDNNGTKIFEGDIVNISTYDYEEPANAYQGKIEMGGMHGVYLFNEKGIDCEREKSNMLGPLDELRGDYLTTYEVIGNIHDKELTE